MADNGMPFVAIIGGFWILKDDPAKLADAKDTARELGAALANARMGLVVYFSNEESLEPHVVSGYVKALRPDIGAGSIRVRFAESQKNEVRFAEQATHSDLFERNVFAGRDWEAPFYRSLVDADGVDAVLLMAGARSTLIAGQIALARPLPVLAIDKFDGAAGIVRTELATGVKDYPSSATHNATELVAWLEGRCSARLKERAAARERERKYLRITSQREKTYWAGSAFFALLAATFFGVTKAPNPEYYPFVTFLGLIAAGATGAANCCRRPEVIWRFQNAREVGSALDAGAVQFFPGKRPACLETE
jgi:hypothetical protein